jgi:hypothetical protein
MPKVVTDADIGNGLEIAANKLKTIPITKSDIGLGNVDNTSDLNKPISTATQSALNLKADLVGGFVPSNQLPSYVDDVIEYTNISVFPTSGDAGKIYVALDSNKVYRWTGSNYIEISQGLTFIDNAMVVSALGYTPYNSTNPAGYISGYSETDTLQSVTSRGSVTSNSITASAFYQTSDERLKDIFSTDEDVIIFKWKDSRDDKIHIGYSAQEINKILPNQVSEDTKGYLSVNYVEVLVSKVRKLESLVEQLNLRIDELERTCK